MRNKVRLTESDLAKIVKKVIAEQPEPSSEVDLKRIGNWYLVTINGKDYNVVIQKDKNKVTCDPSSIIVFNEEFYLVTTKNKALWDKIQKIFENVDYKYDMIDTIDD